MTASGVKSCLPPIVGPETRLLILGSLPGDASLAAERYYAHPRNALWPLVGGLLDVDLVALAYADRLAVLARAGIGLWDTVARAERPGSLDMAMRGAEANDLAALAATLPRLRAVGLNGAVAARRGAAALAGTQLVLVPLPSSSPANTVALARKAATWAALRRFIAPVPIANSAR